MFQFVNEACFNGNFKHCETRQNSWHMSDVIMWRILCHTPSHSSEFPETQGAAQCCPGSEPASPQQLGHFPSPRLLTAHLRSQLTFLVVCGYSYNFYNMFLKINSNTNIFSIYNDIWHQVSIQFYLIFLTCERLAMGKGRGSCLPMA